MAYESSIIERETRREKDSTLNQRAKELDYKPQNLVYYR